MVLAGFPQYMTKTCSAQIAKKLFSYCDAMYFISTKLAIYSSALSIFSGCNLNLWRHEYFERISKRRNKINLWSHWLSISICPLGWINSFFLPFYFGSSPNLYEFINFCFSWNYQKTVDFLMISRGNRIHSLKFA